MSLLNKVIISLKKINQFYWLQTLNGSVQYKYIIFQESIEEQYINCIILIVSSIVILTCIIVASWKWSGISSVKVIIFTAAVEVRVALVHWNLWRPRHFHREDWGQCHWLLGRVQWHWGHSLRSVFYRRVRVAHWRVRLLKPGISVRYHELRWVWGFIFSASVVNRICLEVFCSEKPRAKTQFFLLHTDKLLTLFSCTLTMF